jgi:hypothetical protein
MKELLAMLCFLSLFTGCGSDAPAPEAPEKVYSSLDPTNDVEPAKTPDAPKMEMGSRRLKLIRTCPAFNKLNGNQMIRFYKKNQKIMVWLIEDPLWVTVYTKNGTLLYVKRSCFEKGK